MSSAKNDDKIQLRIRTKNGQFLIDSLTGGQTIGELKCAIWSLTDLHPDNCKIMIGYPPQEIFLVDDKQLINEIIQNRKETMMLEEVPEANRISAASQLLLNATGGGTKKRSMNRIEVPANNSCLFVSVYFCLTGQMQEKCPELRKLIAKTVQSDPITYNEGFLGKPNQEYCDWIQNEDHWGGGIELSILSNYYEIEIVAVDTQNLRLNRFGEDKSYPKRIFLIFDGIHYDPLVVYANDDENPVQTSFSADDHEAIDMALEVAKQAKANHQYTDLNRMSLRCNICDRAFDQDQARAHASTTGHVDFSELHHNKK